MTIKELSKKLQNPVGLDLEGEIVEGIALSIVSEIQVSMNNIMAVF